MRENVQLLQGIGRANWGRSAWIACVVAGALVAGCGSEPSRAVPAACKDRSQIERALLRAPGQVRVAGQPLSGCFVSGADAGDVEAVGFTFVPVVERLARHPRGRNALQLGYLIGAVRRGVAGGNGYAELGRRIEQELAGVDTTDPDFTRGLTAGRAHG